MPNPFSNLLTDTLQLNAPEINALQADWLLKYHVSLHVLRLDKVHPFVSGNKFFKLKYFLEEALQSKHKKIITFGGAYSNHLAATAYACKVLGIESIGVVRGEPAQTLSPTLDFCVQQQMQLQFINRSDYKKYTSNNRKDYADLFGDNIVIPEGGYSEKGALGAATIFDFIQSDFTHICLPTGTATTIAGLIRSASPHTNLIGFSALKGVSDFEKRLHFLGIQNTSNVIEIKEYHFGGYAKKTSELIQFMNNFYLQFDIPSDFVYTGKMFFGVVDLIQKKYFPEGAKILCIHTGGLQGNQSLQKNTLIF